MRIVLVLVTALLLVGSVLATVPAPESKEASRAPAPATLEWVRTRDGWQRPRDWMRSTPPCRTVSPWVAAGFIGLASVLALVAAPTAGLPKS